MFPLETLRAEEDSSDAPADVRKSSGVGLFGCFAIAILACVIVVFVTTSGKRQSTTASRDAATESNEAGDRPSTAASKQSEYSIEQKLSVVDGAGLSGVKVNRFASLLRQLSTTYAESPERVADMTVKAQQILEKEGVQESLVNIMEGMNQIFPTRTPNQTYAGTMALYMGLRTKGRSHKDAVEGLTGMIDDLARSAR